MGAGLVFCLADGSTMNTNPGLSNHLSSCSRSKFASDSFQRWLFMCRSMCQHMSWVGKSSTCMANIFYPTVSLHSVDVTCQSQGCVRSTDSHPNCWRSDLSDWGIYSVLHSDQSEMGNHVDRSRPCKDAYTALAFLCKINMGNASTWFFYWCVCDQSNSCYDSVTELNWCKIWARAFTEMSWYLKDVLRLPGTEESWLNIETTGQILLDSPAM